MTAPRYGRPRCSTPTAWSPHSSETLFYQSAEAERLGAAEYPATCRRKLTKLKKAGVNAVRIAHNPPSTVLLDICDEIGMIVMDEAFDCRRLRSVSTTRPVLNKILCGTDRREAGMPTISCLNIISVTRIITTRSNHADFLPFKREPLTARKGGEAP